VANGNRRPLAPVRKLFAGVLGTCALFVILFGIGMQSLAIAALGVALLVLAVGLVLVTTIRGGARAWVAGTAHVHSVSEPPPSSVFGRCELQVLIDAPGVAARLVRIRDPRVPVAKWPDVGASLPIMVAIDDPRHVRILWDNVQTHAEAAAEREADFGPVSDDYVDLGPDPAPPPAEPTTADLSDDLRDLRDEAPAEDSAADRPVVHQTPGGPIIVEGTLVDPPQTVPPLARRARPDPHRTRAERAAGMPSGGTATATAPPPVDVPTQRGGAEPESGPLGTRRDDVFDQDAPFEEAAWSRPGPEEPAAATRGDDLGEDVFADIFTAYPSARPGDAGATIHGVGLTFLVTDLERSVTFYRDMLGFLEIDGGDRNAVLASGDTRVVLREVQDATPVNRRVVHLNLEVGDVEAMYEDLKAKGVRFTYAPRVVNRGTKLELWAAAFRDPDGHGIAITQWRSREGA